MMCSFRIPAKRKNLKRKSKGKVAFIIPFADTCRFICPRIFFFLPPSVCLLCAPTANTDPKIINQSDDLLVIQCTAVVQVKATFSFFPRREHAGVGGSSGSQQQSSGMAAQKENLHAEREREREALSGTREQLLGSQAPRAMMFRNETKKVLVVAAGGPDFFYKK